MATKRMSLVSEDPQAPEQIPNEEPEAEPAFYAAEEVGELEGEWNAGYKGNWQEEKANDGCSSKNNDEDDEEEPLDKLLELFSKDQMELLLKEALTKYPDLMGSVRKLADADPASRKIFVHGLDWYTPAQTLTSVFQKYGEIEDCNIVTDKVSGRSKGYGFILFKHRSGARKALKQSQKRIGSRMIACQLASTGPVPAPPALECNQRKIFVSNVAADINPQKLLEFFSKFGEIEEGPLGLDKHTGKPIGFCLFVYKSHESAKKALEKPHKEFEGRTLHCRKAIDGPKTTKSNYPQQQHDIGSQEPHHQHEQLQYHEHPSKKGKYSEGSGSAPAASIRHLMAPTAGSAVAATPALTPAVRQALRDLLHTARASTGFGIGNLLGGFWAPVNQGVSPVMNNADCGGSVASGYDAQQEMQGDYENQPQMESQGGVRPQQGDA